MKLLFVSVPKNASASIQRVIGGRPVYGSNAEPPDQNAKAYWMRPTPAALTALKFTTAAGWHKFAVIRHPVDRLLSTWRWAHTPGAPRAPRTLLVRLARRCVTFHNFVQQVAHYITSMVQPMQRLQMVTPQHAWLFDAQNQRLVVDRLLRFETLSSLWSTFAKPWGLSCHLPHIHQSTPLTVTLTRQDLDVIQDVYRLDFTLGNYTMR